MALCKFCLFFILVALIFGCSDSNSDKSVCGEYNSKTHFCDVRDGKIYKYMVIGKQTWMAENLNYYMENDERFEGDNYCYENDQKNCDKYGILYGFIQANKACPSGWHLPSEDEWITLIYSVSPNAHIEETPVYLGDELLKWTIPVLKNNAGKKLKENGFAMQLGGRRGTPDMCNYCPSSFCDIDEQGTWWTATIGNNNNKLIYTISKENEMVSKDAYSYGGHSNIRCVKDTVDNSSVTIYNKEETMKELKRKKNNLRKVYSKELKRHPNFSGDITLKFSVAPSAIILDVSILSSTGLPRFDKEIKEMVLSTYWTPEKESGNDSYIITIPFDSTLALEPAEPVNYHGQTYKTVKMPDGKIWFAENLNYAAKGSKCYKDYLNYCEKYGRLYDFKTAKTACPNGWRLPSREDFDKSNSTCISWSDPDCITEDDIYDYDITAVPSGRYRDYENEKYEKFSGIDEESLWWTTTFDKYDSTYEYRYIRFNKPELTRWFSAYEDTFLSVRCVRDSILN